MQAQSSPAPKGTSEAAAAAARLLFEGPDQTERADPAEAAERPPLAARGEKADDNELLLSAIAARLRVSVGSPRVVPVGLREIVLDCALALERLRPCLAAARAELAGTRAEERRARHDAGHDSLTALPNRSHFCARLDEALQAAERSTSVRPALAVLFLDLDDFKPINDRHGHATGDQMLRIVAQRLRGAVRSEDMVCRLGGDEFACLLATPIEREPLSHLASKLFDAVSAPLKVGALKLTVRPSIGIAMCPTDGDTAAALLKRADSAMYRAKRRQLGFAFFDRRVDA